jgi:hypothetical protein
LSMPILDSCRYGGYVAAMSADEFGVGLNIGWNIGI